MADELPPNSFTLRLGKTVISASGWGLVVLVLVVAAALLILVRY
jgi:hypothetical protein